MRFPWANVLLLVFLILELVSGLLGLMTGSEDRAIYIQLHRVSGYGILLVLVWKSANVVRSLSWPRPSSVRLPSILLAFILVLTLAMGFAWSVWGSFEWWLFSGMSWHIYAGAALAPLLAWHAWYMVTGFPIGFWADRRLVLRASALAIAGFIGWQLVERATAAADLAGSERRFTGSYESRSMSGNDFPRVSWLNDAPRPVDIGSWSLRVTGAAARPMTLRYSDLTADSEVTATIDCTGGWHSTQRWGGVGLEKIVAEAEPLNSARSVVVRSVTGYYRRFSFEAAGEFLLGTHVTGERLSHGHGYPVRLVAPGRRGFEWVKWVTEIEISEGPPWWQPPLPLQ